MTTIRISGIDENVTALRGFQSGLDSELSATMVQATAIVEEAVSAYPAQPPYMGMRKYGSSVKTYIRTGNYGANVHSSVVGEGSTVTGYIESGAPYSIWLRGDSDGAYTGAWMHRGVWASLIDIITEFTPKIVALFEQRIVALIARLFGA